MFLKGVFATRLKRDGLQEALFAFSSLAIR